MSSNCDVKSGLSVDITLSDFTVYVNDSYHFALCFQCEYVAEKYIVQTKTNICATLKEDGNSRS